MLSIKDNFKASVELSVKYVKYNKRKYIKVIYK